MYIFCSCIMSYLMIYNKSIKWMFTHQFVNAFPKLADFRKCLFGTLCCCGCCVSTSWIHLVFHFFAQSWRDLWIFFILQVMAFLQRFVGKFWSPSEINFSIWWKMSSTVFFSYETNFAFWVFYMVWFIFAEVLSNLKKEIIYLKFIPF